MCYHYRNDNGILLKETVIAGRHEYNGLGQESLNRKKRRARGLHAGKKAQGDISVKSTLMIQNGSDLAIPDSIKMKTNVTDNMYRITFALQ